MGFASSIAADARSVRRAQVSNHSFARPSSGKRFVLGFLILFLLLGLGISFVVIWPIMLVGMVVAVVWFVITNSVVLALWVSRDRNRRPKFLELIRATRPSGAADAKLWWWSRAMVGSWLATVILVLLFLWVAGPALRNLE